MASSELAAFWMLPTSSLEGLVWLQLLKFVLQQQLESCKPSLFTSLPYSILKVSSSPECEFLPSQERYKDADICRCGEPQSLQKA